MKTTGEEKEVRHFSAGEEVGCILTGKIGTVEAVEVDPNSEGDNVWVSFDEGRSHHKVSSLNLEPV